MIAFPVLTQAAKLSIDSAQSKIEWVGGKKFVGGKHFGTINVKTGTVNTDDTGKPTSGEFILDMNSIETTDVEDPEKKGMLEGHLKSDDFFGVEKNKESKFVFKSVKDLGNGKYAFSGTLEIKGTPHEETIEATVSEINGSLKAVGEVTIDRTKYGVNYNNEESRGFFSKLLGMGKDKVISNNFQIKLELVATGAESKAM